MNFISEDFHLHYIASYTLFIQSDFKNDYLVVVNEDNEVLVLLHYDNLQPSAEAVRFLSLPFAKVIIGMPHQNLVWVPAEVYDPSEKHLYATYFLDENVDTILARDFDDLAAVALYQYDQLLLNRWTKIFPQARLVPNFEIFIHQAKGYINDQGAILAVYVYDNQADIFLFINGEFKLYNTFEVATADDLNYFVLSILKNFAVTGKLNKVLLSGADKESEWAYRLQNYAENLILLQPKTAWTTSNAGVQQNLSSLNILADTILCV